MPQTVYVERREWEQRLKALGVGAEAGVGESAGKIRHAGKADGGNNDLQAEHRDGDAESEENDVDHDEDYEVENGEDGEEEGVVYSEEEEDEDGEEDDDEEENEYKEYEEYEEDQHKDWQFWPVTSAANLVEKAVAALASAAPAAAEVHTLADDSAESAAAEERPPTDAELINSAPLEVVEAMRQRRADHAARADDVPTDVLRAAHRKRSGANVYSRYVAYQPPDGASDLDV